MEETLFRHKPLEKRVSTPNFESGDKSLFKITVGFGGKAALCRVAVEKIAGSIAHTYYVVLFSPIST